MEWLNGTLWKAIEVILHSRKTKQSEWELVLLDALHSIRSLLCTSTNTILHKRLFNFSRKATSGKSIPSWLVPGLVYVRNHAHKSKYDFPITPATLLHANPQYAHIKLPSEMETTVNSWEVAPFEPSTKETPIIDVGEQAENFEADGEMNLRNIPKSSEVHASPIKPIRGNETTGPSEQIRDTATEPHKKKIPAHFKDCIVAWQETLWWWCCII